MSSVFVGSNRKIDPSRCVHLKPDGTPSLNDRVEIGPTKPAFSEWQQAGDMLAFDTDLVSTYGYCCDISRSWIVGDLPPNDKHKHLYQDAYDHVMTNIKLLEPGMSFFEVTAKSHRLPAAFRPLRYGVLAHGIGLCDEYPSIRYPEDAKHHGYDGCLEQGMTLCVEAYVGAEGGHEGGCL